MIPFNQFPHSIQVKLAQEGLKSLLVAKAKHEQILAHMYDLAADHENTPEYEKYSERIETHEIDLNNIKEKIYAIENWLIDVGAPGWAKKL